MRNKSAKFYSLSSPDVDNQLLAPDVDFPYVDEPHVENHPLKEERLLKEKYKEEPNLSTYTVHNLQLMSFFQLLYILAKNVKNFRLGVKTCR